MNAFFVEKLLVSLLVAGCSVLAEPLNFFRRDKNSEEDSRESRSNEDDDDDDDDKDYLKGIYIAIGVIAGLILVVILFCCICKSKKKKKNALAAVRRPSPALSETNPIKPSAPEQLYSIANNSYTGPVRGTSISSGRTDFSSERSYQNVAYDYDNRDAHMGHMGMGPPPPYFEHEERAPEYTPSVVTLVDTHGSKPKQ